MSDTREFKYRALVSYSHRDTRWAKRLYARLERFTIDKELVGRETEMGRVPKSLRPIFRDREEFKAGETLNSQTIAALDASAALIVVCSPEAARSHYVNEEVRLFKTNQRGRPIIPLIVDGQPGDAERECFPPSLRFVVRADGAITEQPTELLAADIRDNADGWDLALAKVVASLLGLGTDEVFHRAQRLQKRQQRVQTGVGLILLALLISGVLFAWLNYQKQRTLAEIEALVNKYSPISEAVGVGTGTKPTLTEAITAIAQGAATEPRYKQALDLLKAGRPAEAEPLLRAVAEDLAARAGRVSKEAAAAYRHLGAIAGLGDPKRAREAYARVLELNPDDPESLYWSGFLNLLAGNLNVAERALNQLMVISTKTNSARGIYRTHLRLGEIKMARGDLASSMDHQRKALAIAESAVWANPANAEWERDYSVSYEKIGDVQQAQGNLPAALSSFKTSLATRARLAGADPSNAEWQRNLSVSQNKIGDVLRAQGNLPAALESYKASFTIRNYLVQVDPRNAGWQRDLSVSYEKFGDLLQDRGSLSAALENYRFAVAIRGGLAKTDPGNSAWQRDVSICHEKIGDVLRAQGNLSAALESYQASFTIRNHLAEVDAGNAVWQRDLSISHAKIGDMLRVQGNLSAALYDFEAALAIRNRLAKADPSNAELQADTALSQALLGQLRTSLGDKAEAVRLFKAARETLAPLAGHSGNRVWLRYLRNFDAEIDALNE